MKIAVCSQGPEMTSAVDQRFGRCPYFVIFDTEDESVEAIDNAGNTSAEHGAGTGAAQLITNKKVDVVIAGNLGPKAGAVLNAGGVKFISWCEGTVAEAIELAREQ